ncbi:MAG: type II secretion system protein [Clostridiales bacterium]|nr:type II secretion system protein [Clostridiales bacterium]
MKTRKGFTLIEMICVIAMIVLLTAVTLSNVSDYIKRSRDMQAQEIGYMGMMGEQKEEVDKLLTHNEYTPGNPNDDDDNNNTNNNNNGGGGSNNGGTYTPPQSDPTPTPAPTQAPDPTPEPTQAPTPTPEPTQAPTPTPAPPPPPADNNQPGNNGPTENAAGSSVTYASDHWGSKLKFNKNMNEAIIRTDGTGFAVNLNGQYGVEDLGGGRYKVKFQAQGWGKKAKEIPFHVDNQTYFVIESFN